MAYVHIIITRKKIDSTVLQKWKYLEERSFFWFAIEITSRSIVVGHSECCLETFDLGRITGRPDVTKVGTWVTKVFAPDTGPPYHISNDLYLTILDRVYDRYYHKCQNLFMYYLELAITLQQFLPQLLFDATGMHDWGVFVLKLVFQLALLQYNLIMNASWAYKAFPVLGKIIITPISDKTRTHKPSSNTLAERIRPRGRLFDWLSDICLGVRLLPLLS